MSPKPRCFRCLVESKLVSYKQGVRFVADTRTLGPSDTNEVFDEFQSSGDGKKIIHVYQGSSLEAVLEERELDKCGRAQIDCSV